MAYTYDEKRATEAQGLIEGTYYKIINELCSKLEELA